MAARSVARQPQVQPKPCAIPSLGRSRTPGMGLALAVAMNPTWRGAQVETERLCDSGDPQAAAAAIAGCEAVVAELRARQTPLSDDEVGALAALVALGSTGVSTLISAKAADASAQRATQRALFRLRTATAVLAAQLAAAL